MKSWLPRHRFGAEDYSRMRSLGIIKPDVRVELIGGQVIDSSQSAKFTGDTIRASKSGAMDAVPDSWIPFHRFTVEEYYRIAEVGVLAPDARVELIEGEIIDMAPIGSMHCGTVDWVTALFHRVLGQYTIVRTQGVVALDTYSEPQPDVALLRPREDFYRGAHPRAPETFLIVEVSDSSLRLDQTVKIPLFAHFGVPEVWIVDLVHECLHAYRSPRDGGYQDVLVTTSPNVMALSALPGVTVDLTDLFG